MGLIITNSQHYTNIANAIREKTGSGKDFLPQEMANEINNIPTNNLPFYLNKTITHITMSDLPAGTTWMETAWFQELDSLQSVIVPGLMEFGDACFMGCANLAVCEAPDVYYVGDEAFMGTALTEFYMGQTGYIGSSAFAISSNLSKCTIQGGSEIYTGAFAETNLHTLVIRGTTMTSLINIAAFDSTPITTIDETTGRSNGKIYVADSLLDSYKTATNWCNLPSDVWGTLTEYDELYS